jgi:hypothetical protein
MKLADRLSYVGNWVGFEHGDHVSVARVTDQISFALGAGAMSTKNGQLFLRS